MTRKTPRIRSEEPLLDPFLGAPDKAPSEVPLKRMKPSLERLLAETPANNRDEAWEKMAPRGLEF